MQKIVLFILLSTAIVTNAQQLKDGQKITSDILFRDITGVNHSVLNYCRLGKNILLNFFHRDSAGNWAHHQSRTFQNFYNRYKWNNYVFMLEISSATYPLLTGGAAGTQGNWINGTPYPISVLLPAERIGNEAAFYEGTPIGNTDTTMLCLVCADSSAYQIPYSLDSASLTQLVKSKCKFLEESLVYVEDENIRSNVNAKDIFDSVINFAQTISLNKTIILSFFHGNSYEDWKYSDKGYLQQYYLSYEKSGPRDSKVYMIEVDEKTKKDDVLGFGSGPGNWTRTNDFSVTNLDSFNEIKTVMDAFIKEGTLDTSEEIRTPLNFVICSDNKVYRFDTSYNRQKIRDIVTSKCFKWAVGITDETTNSELLISDEGEIHFIFHGQVVRDFNFTVYNSLGQDILNTSSSEPIRLSEIAISKGLYFFNMKVNGKSSSKKIMFE